MKYIFYIFIFVCILSYKVAVSEKTVEQLDPDGNYILTWEINEEESTITFEIEAKTRGYVGIGISPQGQMTGADIFIAGVDSSTGLEYSGDYHATRNGAPILDSRNNWHLLETRETGNHTFIKVERKLNTCDEDEDYPITESTTRLIWSMGTTDDITYHGSTRGTKSIDFIKVPLPDVDITKLLKWDIIVNMTMPQIETTYWCSFHKRMPLAKKHHIVGFEANLINTGGVKHTHHFIAKKCRAPPGMNASEIFEPFLNQPGEICFTREDHSIASSYCSEFLFAWAVGGKITLFPVNVGFPVGSDVPVDDGESGDLYYLMETHFDNPAMEANVHIETGLRVYYTPVLRENDATLLTVGRSTSESILVPPNQSNFVIAGHCPSACTSKFFTADGFKVFNIGLHAHSSGRKARLRHFRNHNEEPWLGNDESYDFNFQQSKTLRKEITILPGDQLTYECTYDSTWNNGQIVLGGLSSRDEMCFVFMWGYGNTTMNQCESYYDSSLNETMAAYGITKYQWDYPNGIARITVLEPPEMAGMNLTHALSSKFIWSPEFIAWREAVGRYGNQEGICGMRNNAEGPFPVRYPNYEQVYVPENPCSSIVTIDTTESIVTGSPNSSTKNFEIKFLMLVVVISGFIFGDY